MKNKNELLKSVIPLICQWYENNKKMLPWRNDPTPYHVWISEIMLQQTRIEAVIPYYERFLSEFPTVASLAEASDERLMKLWQGLGYYSRARNLKKAAQCVMNEYRGEIPDDAENLRKLPGIGEYTAGAIASIAYHKPEPAVDGNVMRVIARLIACEKDVMLPATRKAITEDLKKIYPKGVQAALLTEGLMELGETICIPNGLPRCADCPLHKHCRAYIDGTVAQYPIRSPKKSRRIEEKTVFIFCCEGKYAIRKRPEKGLLAGMWEFCCIDGKLDLMERERFLRKEGVGLVSLYSCGEARHIFTHVEWHMSGYCVECLNQTERYTWVPPEEIISSYAIPTAFRSFLQWICEREI